MSNTAHAPLSKPAERGFFAAFKAGFNESKPDMHQSVANETPSAATTGVAPSGPKKASTLKTVGMCIFGLVCFAALSVKLVSLVNAVGGPSVPWGYGSLKSAAANAVENHMLASGSGMCDSVTNTKMADVRVGTAAFQFGKPGKSITGSYTGTCKYFIVGQEEVKRQTYWFHITEQEGTGRLNGTILLDNPEMVERSLVQSNFKRVE